MNTYPNHRNLEAWDQLYRQSTGRVWGLDPLPFIREWMGELKRHCDTGNKVLDAGTGEGRNIPALIEMQCELFACDASEHALGRVSECLRDNVNLKCCELSKTPFPSQYFRLIVMMDVFETLPCIQDVLAEMHRILVEDGYLYVNIPDFRDPISKMDMVPLEDGGYIYSGRYYFHFYSILEALELLKSAGFELVSQRLHSWSEAPHENYRRDPHEHTSTVFLLKKQNNS